MTLTPHFPLPLRGEWLTPRRFKLLEPFRYVDPEKGIDLTIPAGFVTDFNSVPRAVWWYFSPTDVLEAGLVHDWLYGYPDRFERLSSVGPHPPLSRQQCDDIHRRILHLKGMRLTKRNVIYSALRSGGWKAWNAHRAKDVPDPPPSAPPRRKYGKQVNPGVSSDSPTPSGKKQGLPVDSLPTQL